MRIEFKRVEMRNFMSFAEEAFDFASCKGMSLVQGKNNDIPNAKNGCGKTQCFLSLLYVLFGQLQSKIKNENLVNKYSDDKDMALVLDFSVDGQTYKVRRGLAKGKSSYLEVLKVEDGKEVDITKSTIPETQEMIEKDLLHCDISMFLRTMLLTADQTYNFYTLKKADKKEFVEKLFDISVFEEMYKAMHKDCLTLDKAAMACQSKLVVLNKNQEDYESRKAKFDESLKVEIEAKEQEANKLENELEAARESIAKPNEEAVHKIEAAIDKLQESQDASTSQLNAANAKLSQVTLGIHKLEESKASRNAAINKHKELLDKLCDDCKPIFMDYYSIGTMLSEVAKIDNKMAALHKSETSLNESILAHTAEVESVRSKVAKAREKLKLLVEESVKSSKAVASAESKLNEAKSSLAKLKRSTNPYNELVEKCKDDIQEELDRATKVEDKLKLLRFAESVVSQDTIRKFIIRDLVVLLNNKIKTYLTKLGAQYYVEFDEDMDYEFITPGGSCEWSNFSAGERMRIMIATSFAFRDFMSIRNGLNANILVLDEYFDSAIDTLCIENILSILKDYSMSQGQNIFVISHRPEVSAEQFDRTILVEKTNGIAKLKVM